MIQLLEPAAPPSGTPQARYVRMREHKEGEAYSGVVYGQLVVPSCTQLTNRCI